jgi:hypothetical protein
MTGPFPLPLTRDLMSAPTATRTRDLLLRSSSKASLRPVILQLSGQRDLSVSDCLAPPLLSRSGTRRARCSKWSTGETTSMRTTGAHEDGATSAAHKRCLRSCIPAVVRSCCCTFCCTELPCESWDSSVRLPPTRSLHRCRWPLRPEANARCGLPPLLLRLTCLAPSVDVRWRSLVSVAVVTHLASIHRPNRVVSGRGNVKGAL